MVFSGRARLFEVVQKVKEANAKRLLKAQGQLFQVLPSAILN